MNKGEGHSSLHRCFAAAALIRLHYLAKSTNIGIIPSKNQAKSIYINVILDIDFCPHPGTQPNGLVTQSKSKCTREGPYQVGTSNEFGGTCTNLKSIETNFN